MARRFVDRINAHDVEGLISLMTSDHAFVDSLGDVFTRPVIEEGWRQYFAMVPDYWIKIERAYSHEGVSILVGVAGGTYLSRDGAAKVANKWETPAVWTVKVEGNRVAEWRIYADNEPIRAIMRRQTR